MSRVSEVGQSEGRTIREGEWQLAHRHILLKLKDYCLLNVNSLGKNHESSA